MAMLFTSSSSSTPLKQFITTFEKFLVSPCFPSAPTTSLSGGSLREISTIVVDDSFFALFDHVAVVSETDIHKS